MGVIGFNFEKVNVEKTAKLISNMSIKTDLKVTSLEDEKVKVGQETKDTLKINFEFSVDYSPNIGKMVLGGHLLYLDEPKKLKELQKKWEKKENFPLDFIMPVLNEVVRKCNITSLFLSEEVGLPPHIKLPKLTPSSSMAPAPQKSKAK
ncbi:hypothetical protein HY643_01700 [Candidatus Woesearchaeota archaeon]|nr:hypothetical protein [Candidatus Woesearchaeota archaeon]